MYYKFYILCMIENRVKLRLVLIKEKALAQINEFKVSHTSLESMIMCVRDFLNVLSGLGKRPGYQYRNGTVDTRLLQARGRLVSLD